MKKTEKYLNKCIKLALKGKGKTNPNPLVGCVIVKDDEVVSEAYHEKAGELHAERIALKKAGKKAQGAVLYTNLEPCVHYGKTPPCTKKIMEYGISKVVYSMIDPNPVNNGKGIKELKNEGIEVKGGILKQEAKELNSIYIKYITEEIPYITIKVAQSLDGKIATSMGNSKWISGGKSREKVHQLRNIVDAVAVGINTVIADDPELIPRLEKEKVKKISRIIFDSKLRIPLDCKLIKKVKEFPLIIFTSDEIDFEKRKLLEKKGATVISSEGEGDEVDLPMALAKLADRNISHVLVEGGGKIIASLLTERLADEIFCFIAPKIIGGKNAISSVEGNGVKNISEAIELKKLDSKKVGKDILIHGHIRK